MSLRRACLAALLAVTLPSVCLAQESAQDAARASARQLANEASEAYVQGDYAAAYDGFNRAFRLVGVPSLGVWSARSLRQAGRLVEASERYREVTRLTVTEDSPAGSAQALQEAQAELDELLPRIPNLVIVIENADPEEVEVDLNGNRVPLALLGAKQRVDPGQHRIHARRGDEVLTEEVAIAERQSLEVRLAFTTKAEARSPVRFGGALDEPRLTGLQKAGIASMGVGGALLIGGAVTTYLALQRQSDLRESCLDHVCPPSRHDELESFNTLKALSLAGFIGAGVFGAAGATLYFTGRPAEGPQVALWFGGTSANIQGTF